MAVLFITDNLANNPEFFQKVEEMHAQLKADMEELNDSFSTENPKKEKRNKRPAHSPTPRLSLRPLPAWLVHNKNG